jgi:hypothetical protein
MDYSQGVNRNGLMGPIDRYPVSEPISTRTPGPIVELIDTFCT